MLANLDPSIVKLLEQKELSSRYGCECKETAVKNKVLPAEPVKTASVKCNYSNPATNWWLALIAFLLFLMLCTNSNFN